jgi:hypothetical protein
MASPFLFVRLAGEPWSQNAFSGPNQGREVSLQEATGKNFMPWLPWCSAPSRLSLRLYLILPQNLLILAKLRTEESL